MKLQCTSDMRSNICILETSYVVMPFKPLWTQFFVVHNFGHIGYSHLHYGVLTYTVA
jgi:hypothetical protein